MGIPAAGGVPTATLGCPTAEDEPPPPQALTVMLNTDAIHIVVFIALLPF